MPSFTNILSVAALAALAQAISITSPSQDSLWNSDDTNTITWTSVSTDPTTVDIYIVHQASQPQTRDLLFSNVATSQGSIDVSGLQLPVGDTYQINFVKPNSPEQIYAQSDQFNVTGVATDATSTLAGYTGPTFTPSTAASTATSTSTSTSASAESTETSSLTSSSSGSASGTATVSVSSSLTTSTGSSTTSTGTVAVSTSSGTATSGTASGTASASSSASSAAASGNAAVDMRASAPLAALVFGAFAMLA